MTPAERETAVELVQQAYADGRLQPAELEQRLELALTATSWEDLGPILADLSDDAVLLETTGGNIRRAGDWQVPRRLRVSSEYGRVRLDLSRAVIRHPHIEIDLRLPFGSATIILPAGASANVDGVRTEWGSVVCKVPGSRFAGGPHVRVTGELTYGRLTIRTAHSGSFVRRRA
ncbi:DUF1707 domain-containing protein [Nonomuraea sp. MCN248]|uniref:DUF1707 domain-containing protein n=1 Tax=Nonomuraea corallina TaxID=2989783 RepID=A0ABT4SCU7_9ACTN|nr:DUF1707 domain-containing protein [Nonomuraea corallina]MDA0634997.1 DUF1707 domain-containing protein [Nonomuraea corallina]